MATHEAGMPRSPTCLVGVSLERGSSKAATEVCARCPVVEECFPYALENREAYGIWGEHLCARAPATETAPRRLK